MKAHISIRSIGWGIKYGTWVGKRNERKKITNYIQGRIDDFKICTKNDCCKDHIYVLEGILKDIKDNEQSDWKDTWVD